MTDLIDSSAYVVLSGISNAYAFKTDVCTTTEIANALALKQNAGNYALCSNVSSD